MKCLQKLYSSPSWLVVSLCLLCTLFLTTININSVSAVSSLSYNLNSQVSFPFYICNDSNASAPHCTDYHYIIIEADNPFNGNAYDTIVTGLGAIRIPVFGYSVIEIKDSFSQYGLWFNGVNHTFKLTLVDSLDSSVPSGSLSITSNGTYDVTNYAEAVVDVPPEIIQGDYHDDLVNLKQAIILVPAVCLVIYFFYAIYKMIMGGVRR